MPHLREVDLSGQRNINAASLAGLPGLPRLQAFHLGPCPALCEEGYQIIACLTQLTQLCLDCGGAESGILHMPDRPPKKG